MAHWKYLSMIATINKSLLNKRMSHKGLLNKKMWLSIIVVFRQNFLNTFLKIAILGNIFINVAIVTQNWSNIGSNVYVSTTALLPTFLITKKSGPSISAHFHKNSVIVTCCTFGRFEIRIFKPNRFKNQTNDTLKLLGHNYNHQWGFLKQKIVTLHRCSFNLKFPKHCYFDRCFG